MPISPVVLGSLAAAAALLIGVYLAYRDAFKHNLLWSLVGIVLGAVVILGHAFLPGFAAGVGSAFGGPALAVFIISRIEIDRLQKKDKRRSNFALGAAYVAIAAQPSSQHEAVEQLKGEEVIDEDEADHLHAALILQGIFRA
jgi:hypothetical protein